VAAVGAALRVVASARGMLSNAVFTRTVSRVADAA
jgi:hypothetical protein